jgi:hypothetical protein
MELLFSILLIPSFKFFEKFKKFKMMAEYARNISDSFCNFINIFGSNWNEFIFVISLFLFIFSLCVLCVFKAFVCIHCCIVN